MSGRFSLNAWNDWRWVERGIVDVTVLRVNFDYLRAQWVSVDFVLLGFGFSLSYYFAHNSAVIWEPIELDGYAGEPQGQAVGGYIEAEKDFTFGPGAKVTREPQGMEKAP